MYFFVLCVCADTDSYWEQLAACRTKLQRVGKQRLLVMDQTGIKATQRAGYTLAPSGVVPRVRTTAVPTYTPRFDVMGALLSDQVLPVDVLTPARKRTLGIKGYTKRLVLDYLRTKLAPALTALNRDRVVVAIDKGLALKKQDVVNAFSAGGYDGIEDVVIFPTATAKYLSPLDNNFWSAFKRRFQNYAPTTDTAAVHAIHNAWKAATAQEIDAYYHHCALYRGDDPYSGRT